MDQRRTRRFTIQLPISITRNGPERIMQMGFTRNISSGGVLFTIDKEPGVGASIEYVINLGGTSSDGVNLRCIGKVLRTDPSPGDSTYDVAATLERYEFVRSEE